MNIYNMMFNSFNGFDDINGYEGSMNFSDIVYEYGLKPDFFLTREDGKIIINEIWSCEKSDVSANRIYEFDSFFIDLVPDEIKLSVLEDILDIYVYEENYEEAIIIRDAIKEIK